jgi:hypothetical protein
MTDFHEVCFEACGTEGHRIRKTIVKSEYYLTLSVCPSAWNITASGGRIFMKFYTEDFY